MKSVNVFAELEKPSPPLGQVTSRFTLFGVTMISQFFRYLVLHVTPSLYAGVTFFLLVLHIDIWRLSVTNRSGNSICRNKKVLRMTDF